MSGRAKIGFTDALGELDDFAPKSRPRVAPPAPEIAEAAGFRSREPALAAAPAKQQRRHRTGRSAQINIKAKPETIEAFYAWAEAQDLSIAEAFEVAIKKLSSS